MTVEEIESACDKSQDLGPRKHELEVAELSLRQVFYPLGFPTEVRTNSAAILSICGDLWGAFRKEHDTAAIRVDIHVVDSELTECPPEPKFRMMLPLMVLSSDAETYSIVDLDRGTTVMTLPRIVEEHSQYLRYFFLAGAAGCHISTQHSTPIHAGCVALDGRGVMLCGDSGAGKSTLSYACARAGWTFVSDDGSFLLNGGAGRLVSGNFNQVRFRPAAVELFPEVVGVEITERAVSKPSLLFSLDSVPHIARAQTTPVDFVVFLNRRSGGPPELRPYKKDVARYFMRQHLYGSQESLAVRYEAIERLLAAQILELRYTRLDDAIDMLQTMVREQI
jgi:hypothetical protein